jgi:hypothetical protein
MRVVISSLKNIQIGSLLLIRGIKLMTTYINLSAHSSIKLLPNAPWIVGENPKTGREIKVADLSVVGNITEYLYQYTMAEFAGNKGEYPNPQVKQVESATYNEVLDDGTVITHNVGSKTVIQDLPVAKEGVIYITSFATAREAKRKDIVCCIIIADPSNGQAVGAIGYTAFG